VIDEFDPSFPSCARSEDVVHFAEVEKGCRNGEVEVFSGEQCELSGR
jgi:hypothetical protein